MISVVIPAFNEAELVERCLRETLSVLNYFEIRHEVILVDDGSEDSTLELARAAAEELPHVRVIGHEVNLGKGSAVQRGALAARGDLVLTLDADLEVHPRQIALLYEALVRTGADVVIGSKLHPDSKTDVPPGRRTLTVGYYVLVRTLFRLPVHDTQTGLKLFKREPLMRVMPRLLVKRFAYDLELLVNLHRDGYKIVEAPVVVTRTARVPADRPARHAADRAGHGRDLVPHLPPALVRQASRGARVRGSRRTPAPRGRRRSHPSARRRAARRGAGSGAGSDRKSSSTSTSQPRDDDVLADPVGRLDHLAVDEAGHVEQPALRLAAARVRDQQRRAPEELDEAEEVEPVDPSEPSAETASQPEPLDRGDGHRMVDEEERGRGGVARQRLERRVEELPVAEQLVAVEADDPVRRDRSRRARARRAARARPRRGSCCRPCRPPMPEWRFAAADGPGA